MKSRHKVSDLSHTKSQRQKYEFTYGQSGTLRKLICDLNRVESKDLN